MRWVWKWFNRLSTYMGGAYFLAECGAWLVWSIHAGHTLGYREFNQRFEQTVFELAQRLGLHLG
jgi:hypothetical protein